MAVAQRARDQRQQVSTTQADHDVRERPTFGGRLKVQHSRRDWRAAAYGQIRVDEHHAHIDRIEQARDVRRQLFEFGDLLSMRPIDPGQFVSERL